MAQQNRQQYFLYVPESAGQDLFPPIATAHFRDFNTHSSNFFKRLRGRIPGLTVTETDCIAAVRFMDLESDKTIRRQLYGAGILGLGPIIAGSIWSAYSHSEGVVMSICAGVLIGLFLLLIARDEHKAKQKLVHQLDLERTLLKLSDAAKPTMQNYETKRRERNLQLGAGVLLLFASAATAITLTSYNHVISVNVGCALALLAIGSGMLLLGAALFNPDPGAEDLLGSMPRPLSTI